MILGALNQENLKFACNESELISLFILADTDYIALSLYCPFFTIDPCPQEVLVVALVFPEFFQVNERLNSINHQLTIVQKV